jgi:hypothetical protein
VATSIPCCNYLCAPYYNSMDTQETYIRVRVSDELKADMEKTAKAKGLTLSGWLRMVAIEAIEAAKDARNKGSE